MIKPGKQNSIYPRKNYLTMMRFVLVLLVAIFMGKPAMAQSGEEIFAKNCVACHTIGSGNLVGPDLKGVEERRSIDWIGQFILSSEKLINSGDQDAIDNFEFFNKIKMQDFNFNTAQLADLINYIVKAGGGEMPAPKVEEIILTPEEKEIMIPVGSRLFQGYDKFSDGGVACFACHHVSYEGNNQGGSLGTDLTSSFTKYNGAAGLKGFIMTPSSMIMEMEYSKHPLTQEEIMSLVVFLEDANGNGTPEFESTGLFVGGIILSCIMIFLIMIIWSEKKRNGINSEIISRQVIVKIS